MKSLRNKWNVIIAPCSVAYRVEEEFSWSDIVRRFSHQGRLGNLKRSIKRILTVIAPRMTFCAKKKLPKNIQIEKLKIRLKNEKK